MGCQRCRSQEEKQHTDRAGKVQDRRDAGKNNFMPSLSSHLPTSKCCRTPLYTCVRYECTCLHNILTFLFFQINSQLLESIQQKVELSQQLDQWQADMEELLEEQMMKKMRAQENKSGNDSDSSNQAAESRKSKILAFFGR